VGRNENGELLRNGIVVTDEFVGTGALEKVVRKVTASLADSERVVSVINGKYVRGLDPRAEAIYLNEDDVPYGEILSAIYPSSIFNELQRTHGCEFYCRSIAIFKTLPRPDIPFGSLRFHRDGHPPYSFKILVYLTDVSEESGPTSYVPMSVKRLIPEFGLYKIVRPVEEQAYKKYSVLGMAGTAMLFNVNGAHAGGRTLSGERIIMTMVFQPRWAETVDRLNIAKQYRFSQREYDVL
jgi:hypothetical protein